MNTREQALDILKGDNPFISTSVGNPRERRFPDVPGLGDDVLLQLKGLIQQSTGRPDMPCAAAVLGEPGSGKTHLIGRLMDESMRSSHPFSFAYIIPFIDHNKGFRYLLRETFVNLTYLKYEITGCNRLDMLASQVIEHILLRLTQGKRNKKIVNNLITKKHENPIIFLNIKYKEELNEKIFKDIIKLLGDEFPGINKPFFKVFIQYCFYPNRRDDAKEWFQGEMVASDSITLTGVSSDRSYYDPVAHEEEAREILKSLDMLLSKFGDPLVCFFDQLENFTEGPEIRIFEKILHFLCDQTQAMIPIVFIRGTDWNLRFHQALNEHVRERISSNLFILKGCSRDQSLYLIQSRLDTALQGLEIPGELFPFNTKEKSELSLYLSHATEFHPRKIIIQANGILNKMLYHTPPLQKTFIKALEEALHEKYHEIKKEFDRYLPDQGRLLMALKLYLSCRNPENSFTLSGMVNPPQSSKYISLEAQVRTPTQDELPVAFVIDVERHHRAVGASLRHGLKYMESLEGSRVLYIRDKRCSFPERWIQTQALLSKLKENDGATIFLEKEDAAWWYALSLLKFDVEAGDISSGNGQPVGIDQFKTFIAEHIDGNSHPTFNSLDRFFFSNQKSHLKEKKIPGKPKSPSKTSTSISEEMIQKAIRILKQSAAKMMVADKLADKLFNEINQTINPDTFLTKLENRKDLFTIIPAKDGHIIRLKGCRHD